MDGGPLDLLVLLLLEQGLQVRLGLGEVALGALDGGGLVGMAALGRRSVGHLGD